MAKENICNSCSKKQVTGIRVIRSKSGEISRQYNYTCEGYNLSLFNLQVPTNNHCIRHTVIPQSNTFNN